MKLIYIDTETTGVDINNDQIVEITIISDDFEYTKLIQPTIPIDKRSSNIHGIYMKDVEDAPTFSMIIDDIMDLLDDCDIIVGYNHITFDIPLINNELKRNGSDYVLSKPTIDLYRTWMSIEKTKKLGDCYLRYTNKPLLNAHSSLHDVRATVEILEKQMSIHKMGFEDLIKLSSNQNEKPVKQYIEDEVFKFGKYKTRKIKEVAEKNPQYLEWLSSNEGFSKEFRDKIKSYLK